MENKSMLEPYKDLIADLLQSGCTYEEITEELNLYEDEPEKIKKENVISYIKSHGLISFVTQGARNGRIYIPECRGCDECVVVTNTNEGKIMMCIEKMHLISKSCKSSPMWCHKRDADRTKLAELYGIIPRKAN